jgi:transposase-like protein
MIDISSHTDMITYDPEKHYLGKLCKRSHDYRGTGQTLRYKKYVCIACKKLYYLENGDTIRARQRARRANNPEMQRRYDAAYYRKNRDHFSEYRKKRYYDAKSRIWYA